MHAHPQAPVRDHMLSQFTKQPGSIVRNTVELQSVKCSFISTFSTNLSLVLSVYSLKIQAIRCFQNLTRLLEDFPATKEAHFIIGEPKSVDTAARFNFSTHCSMDPSGRLLAAEIHKSRPHQLVTRDGRLLLNLFYIPHFTEVSN